MGSRYAEGRPSNRGSGPAVFYFCSRGLQVQYVHGHNGHRLRVPGPGASSLARAGIAAEMEGGEGPGIIAAARKDGCRVASRRRRRHPDPHFGPRSGHGEDATVGIPALQGLLLGEGPSPIERRRTRSSCLPTATCASPLRSIQRHGAARVSWADGLGALACVCPPATRWHLRHRGIYNPESTSPRVLGR